MHGQHPDPARRQKGLKIIVHIPDEVPDGLVGDAGRLRQILVNLLGNAVKFTEHGEVAALVETTLQEEDAITLHFAVRDTGIGISDDKKHLLFNPFSQIDTSLRRRYEGTGLGLAISARLVEMMGGRIWVESELGKGSTFHFTARFELQKGTSEQSRPAALLPGPEVRSLPLAGRSPASWSPRTTRSTRS